MRRLGMILTAVLLVIGADRALAQTRCTTTENRFTGQLLTTCSDGSRTVDTPNKFTGQWNSVTTPSLSAQPGSAPPAPSPWVNQRCTSTPNRFTGGWSTVCFP
jgi:hypothetical protein